MPIYTQSSDDGNTLTIRVEGRFDFGSYKDFSQAYKTQAKPGLSYQVDLSKTDSMDSAAMGMLLIIKEYAEANRGTVTLHGPPPDIRKIFEVANFFSLFTIEDS